MGNGIVPLAGAASDFSERKFRRGVGGIEFQLLLEFFFGFRGVGFRVALGKRYAAETEMNSRRGRVLVENFLVFGGGLVPAALGFRCFCREFMRLVGVGSFLRKFLRSAGGQLAKI